MVGPSLFSGARFVARRDEKRLRRVRGGLAKPDHGTMLALYWTAGDGADHWA
jgi:hypothetical protein